MRVSEKSAGTRCSNYLSYCTDSDGDYEGYNVYYIIRSDMCNVFIVSSSESMKLKWLEHLTGNQKLLRGSINSSQGLRSFSEIRHAHSKL